MKLIGKLVDVASNDTVSVLLDGFQQSAAVNKDDSTKDVRNGSTRHEDHIDEDYKSFTIPTTEGDLQDTLALPLAKYVKALEESLNDRLLAEAVFKLTVELTSKPSFCHGLLRLHGLQLIANVILKHNVARTIQSSGAAILSNVVDNVVEGSYFDFMTDRFLETLHVLLVKSGDDSTVQAAVFNILSRISYDEGVKIRLFQMGDISVLLKNAISCIQSRETSFACCDVIVDLASTDLTKAAACSSGAVSLVAGIMAAFPDDREIQCRGCIALSALTTGADNVSLLIGRLELRQLLHAMTSFLGDKEIQSLALDTITMAMADAELLHVVSAENGVTILIEAACCRDMDERRLDRILSLLEALYATLEATPDDKVISAKDLDVFLLCLEINHTRTRLVYLLLLFLTGYALNEKNHELLCEVTAVDRVTSLIEEQAAQDRIVECGCRYLAILSCGSYASQVLSHRVLAKLYETVTRLEDSFQLQRDCMAAMVNIIAHDQQSNQCGNGCSWVGVVLKNMKRHDDDTLVQTLGCLALSSLTYTAVFSHCDEIVECLSVICHSMASTGRSSAEVQLWGGHALLNCIESEALLRLDDDDIRRMRKTVLNGMLRFPSDGRLQLVAAQIMNTLLQTASGVCQDDIPMILHACEMAIHNFPCRQLLRNTVVDVLKGLNHRITTQTYTKTEDTEAMHTATTSSNNRLALVRGLETTIGRRMNPDKHHHHMTAMKLRNLHVLTRECLNRCTMDG